MSVGLQPDRPSASSGFVLGWALSLALPVLLLPLVQLGFADLYGQPSIFVAIAGSYLTWAMTGALQFALLRGTPLRPRLWLAATVAGGVLGQIANGFVRLQLQTHFDITARADNKFAELLSPFYSYLPFVIAELGCAAIVALAQSFCFVETVRERVPWFLISLLASVVGSFAGIAAFIYSSRSLATSAVLDFVSTPVMFSVVYLMIINVVGYAVFGLLTGFCLRGLLARRLRLQHAGMIGQFD